jgi:hypothetical protein
MLRHYQTRVIESAIATLRQYLPSLRDTLHKLATTIREGHTPPAEAGAAWLQLEALVDHLEVLDRARKAFAQSDGAVFADDGGEGADVIRGIRSAELGKLLHTLHEIVQTPVAGFVSEELSS